jgi:hypothetical protein
MVEDCITTLSTGRETEKQAMFLAILWLENYKPEAQWTMDDCPQEWDPKVSELLDRLFRSLGRFMTIKLPKKNHAHHVMSFLIRLQTNIERKHYAQNMIVLRIL